MHVYPGDAHACIFPYAVHMRHLIDRDTELGIHMAHRCFEVAPCHDMGVDTDAHGHVWMYLAKLLKDGQVIQVDMRPERQGLFYFPHSNPVRGETDMGRIETRRQPELDFFDRNGVQSRAQAAHKLEYAQVAECFTGIMDAQVRHIECGPQALVLPLDDIGVVNVQRCPVLAHQFEGGRTLLGQSGFFFLFGHSGEAFERLGP